MKPTSAAQVPTSAKGLVAGRCSMTSMLSRVVSASQKRNNVQGFVLLYAWICLDVA